MSSLATAKSRTLNRSIRIEGKGVHSNMPCSVLLKPTTGNSGLRFIHSASSTIIPIHISSVQSTSYATTLSTKGIEIQTVEHLLSALVGLSIFNLDIVLESPALIQELPILDGSSRKWVDAVLNAGIINLEMPQKTIKIKDRIQIVRGDKSISIEPASGLIIDYTIQFKQSVIGKQRQYFSLNPQSYMAEIGSARTFCLESDILAMKKLGLAKGGSLDNALVFTNDGPLNQSLRYLDEPVRHKILDLIGDLALLGCSLEGKIIAHGAGHQLHVELCRNILREVHKWEMVTLAS